MHQYIICDTLFCVCRPGRWGVCIVRLFVLEPVAYLWWVLMLRFYWRNKLTIDECTLKMSNLNILQVTCQAYKIWNKGNVYMLFLKVYSDATAQTWIRKPAIKIATYQQFSIQNKTYNNTFLIIATRWHQGRDIVDISTWTAVSSCQSCSQWYTLWCFFECRWGH